MPIGKLLGTPLSCVALTLVTTILQEPFRYQPGLISLVNVSQAWWWSVSSKQVKYVSGLEAKTLLWCTIFDQKAFS